ncbi:MAG: helix-turn-helix transcriptional regulator [bacterium]|nr:helix-turn-helix transcriptional regulator [bacterium]
MTEAGQSEQPLKSYDRQRFGKAVRKYRGDEPARDFSERVGMAPAVLSRIERGKEVEPRYIDRLCEVMNVSLDDFPSGAAGRTRQDVEKS